jgi:ADP-dependent NAD(P)H-hydrate dehydratase / NAD(P)H-hydrate epimerase
VRIAADEMTLATSGLSTLESVDARGVAVSVEGPATDRILDVAAWASKNAGALHVPASAKDVKLEWRANADAPAWLTMTGGSMTGDGKTAELKAATTAFGVPMGVVRAAVVVDVSGVTLEAGKKQGVEAPIQAKLHTSARPPTLGVTLRPVELAALGAAMGVALPTHAATLSGHADLTLGHGASGVAGTASLEIDGWVPQHPKVLDGIVSGKKTTSHAHLQVAEDRATIKLDDVEVRAGKLALKGSGTMAEEAHHPILRLDLSGPIPCAELARGTASNELPGLLGEIAGEVAGHTVSGAATVNVSVEADAKNLAAAKITPKVSVGCQLKLPGL